MNEKKKHKIMLGIEVILLCMIVAILGTNAASSNPPSNGVSYGKNNQDTVEGALNDLYTKSNYGNATAAQILKDKTALVGGKQVIGTYEAPSLASQTPGDATETDIAEGKIAWVNGKKIVGFKPLAEKVNLGDYIKYTSSREYYTISKSDTGYDSDQGIDMSRASLWRVIRKNSDGTVDVVRDGVSEKICLNGEIGFRNGVGVLNKIAKAYENTTYTVGARHMGYDGSSETCTGALGSCNSQGKSEDKQLVAKAIGNLLIGTGEGFSYWLARRLVDLNGLGGDNRYHSYYSLEIIEGIGASYNLSADTLIIDSKGQSKCNSVRPIVILKSRLKITGGDGTKSSPYTLGV